MSSLSTSPLRRGVVAGAACAALLVTTAAGTAVAKPPKHGPPGGAPSGVDALQLEHLDRGLVAATTEDGVHLSWRLLGHEATAHGEGGLTGADFHVYRDGERIATVTDSTNHLDPGADGTATYRVAAVVDGHEVDLSDEVAPWADEYYDLPLQRPDGGVTPSGEEYTYAANDMSVGDVTGDGRYEFVVKWDPSNSRDVSQVGYTGPVYVDTYTLEGELLHRIDLGVNIRAGAHYTQFLVYDFDGDGRSEMMMKTAPGTRTVAYEDGEPGAAAFVTMPDEDVEAGYSHQDDYRKSAEDYYEHVVEMFLGWHEHPEVVDGSWPATLEEAFGIEPEHEYPLSRQDAEALTDYFMDEYAPGRSARNDLRAFEGFILDGPEYLTVFDGLTGAELQTIPYTPERHDDGLMWGDYAMSRIEPGNRVDRFLSGVAYLDGQRPSAIFARGYYTRSTIVAYDWDGERLREVWDVDSGWTPMSNPFNDGPHGVDGTDPEFGTITTQGQHSLSAADVDGDGKHEIVYGAATIDHDGSLLYSAFAEMPEGSAAPGEMARLGHGDAMHVGQLDPDREGIEAFMVFEGGAWAPYGMAMLDAATGEVLWGTYSGRDTGRGMVGDVLPDSRGIEAWASMPGGSGALGLHTPQGEVVSDSIPGTNQTIRWAADMTTQVVNGTATETVVTPTIDDWQRGTLLSAEGTATNNWTKGNPSLVADVFGDWREELLVRTLDSSAIRIYLSTEVTDRKLYTLMHDPQYRAEIARQQTVYNQPAYTSFYLASDLDWSQVPLPEYWAPGGLEALSALLDGYVEDGQVKRPTDKVLQASLRQAERHLDAGRVDQAVRALERFERTLDRSTGRQVSDEAKSVLGHRVQTLITQLGR
ncbi:rhamnogalacturonan lyase [Actinotalea sp. BY-33]|uniref:Rhamnogalacturonan lyase n=1 Tax=Actinotalea soli TaxID=2819234 RepID=A0A939RVI1_9CELL|nr:rhamnogalacturonan lyase [Actinotalea soli]MBO1751643.1 rhamnogalacturonan lyase [Actinotalea soli]